MTQVYFVLFCFVSGAVLFAFLNVRILAIVSLLTVVALMLILKLNGQSVWTGLWMTVEFLIVSQVSYVLCLVATALVADDVEGTWRSGEEDLRRRFRRRRAVAAWRRRPGRSRPKRADRPVDGFPDPLGRSRHRARTRDNWAHRT